MDTEQTFKISDSGGEPRSGEEGTHTSIDRRPHFGVKVMSRKLEPPSAPDELRTNDPDRPVTGGEFFWILFGGMNDIISNDPVFQAGRSYAQEIEHRKKGTDNA
jgi:hypothetical protein